MNLAYSWLSLQFLIALPLSFLAAQRLVLDSINIYICILFYFTSIYLYFIKKVKEANAYLIFSVFVSVDIGLVYNSTPSFLRYVIYVTIIFLFLVNTEFNRAKVGWYFVFIGLVIFKSLFSLTLGYPVSINHVISDITFLLLVFISFCTAESKLAKYDVCYRTLFFLILFFLFGELLNSTFFELSIHGYMSYDTTKALIVFPLFYMLCKSSSNILKIFIFCITSFVIVMYVTRMIVLSTFIVIFLLFLKNITLKNSLIFMLALLFSPLFIGSVDVLYGYKATSSFINAFDSESLIVALEKLDPIRVAEQRMLFSRNPVDILFGTGVGFGFFDKDSIFSFVNNSMAAFTDEEMYSRNFFNFHDVWVDYGYRFGILFFIIYFSFLIKKIQLKDPNVRLVSAILIVLSFCSFFSTPGLLLISFFFLNLRYRLLVRES
ncbi:hypothetical protein [Pseudoalteromonas sp. GB43]